MNTPDLISVGYLIAAVLFIFGLKGLGRPRTAPRGNLMGATGMLLAVLVTLLDQAVISYLVIVAALAIGSVIGVLLAVKIKMTSMPELVALFNGFGGGASVLVAIASFIEAIELGRADNQLAIAAAATALIGAITFTGSVIAFFKLQESLKWSGFTGLPLARAFVLLVSLLLAMMVAVQPDTRAWLWALVAAGLILGVISTIAIGGADMPVVIALLNAFSGVAASTTGFVLDNSLLIIAGSLVGASGLILTQIMCSAMNRSIFEVIFADTPSATAGSRDDSDVYGDRVTSTSAEEVAMLLEVADRVVIVPGYGLAVAQAQHAVRDLMTSLESSGKEVVFGIHPVAGRMPGHMNVLLAEAEIGYEHLFDMDQVNPTFAETDVTIVIGANDVVNPAARNDPSSPIAGMPILDVDESGTVVVIKRSLSPGFAGIANPLFAADNALMLFGDGKQAVIDIAAALVSV
ncbi:MAG TPA: NAD synthetase [Acidimicrobiaceae bacterium]|jgi:NAD(P) transhydrogenase subunit beta|nr:NAD synthetase [Acidimicrobiaceae bacterium]HJO80764.1 NAD(P)(+) transhydrogenase (Re/Si-specific) subunit beta [Acidimicrobiales bacterium]|tara:strand:+ start:2406 stop:3791 length:1386 start_codon:yes stop_codon:yes gene_type:complete